MKRPLLLLTMSILFLAGCSPRFSVIGLEPIEPPLSNNSRHVFVVASLQPTLRWHPNEEPCTYDVVIYERVEAFSANTYWHSYRGKQVYYREGLTDPVHRVEEALQPNQAYAWSVRVRRDGKTYDWSTCSYKDGDVSRVNDWFAFRTPKQKTVQQSQ